MESTVFLQNKPIQCSTRSAKNNNSKENLSSQFFKIWPKIARLNSRDEDVFVYTVVYEILEKGGLLNISDG